MRAKADAFVGDLDESALGDGGGGLRGAEAEDLKAAGVGEDRALPGGKAGQVAVASDDVGAGTKPQVIGVAEDDLDLAAAVLAAKRP